GDGVPAKPVRPVPSAGDGGAKSAGGKRRRVVIDSQAARRDHMSPPPPQRPPRRRGGRRPRPLLGEPPSGPQEPEAPQTLTVNSGATVREVAETLGLGSAEVIKALMEGGEMATLTQTLTDDSIKAIAKKFDRTVEVVTAAEEEEAAAVELPEDD